MEKTMAGKAKNHKILCLGLSCVDIISICKSYPQEDSDQRCIDQRWARGGNASNTASVISLLPTNCAGHYIGTLARSHELGFIEDDLRENGVDFSSCVYCDDSHCPVSIVIVNEQNGSRTIVHSNKNLPELSTDQLSKIDLSSSELSWIHFEGRPNVAEQIEFLRRIEEFNKSVSFEKRITTSVELEKTRNELSLLLDKADVVFVSKEHAQHQGYKTKEEAIRNILVKCRNGAILIIPWGEEGAVAMVNSGSSPDSTSAILTASIHPPTAVVDTLAAGDTFIGGTISALCNGVSLEKAIDYGCRVAGTKCGLQGLRGLRECMELRLDKN